MSLFGFLAKKKPAEWLQSGIQAAETGDITQAQKDLLKALELAEEKSDYDIIAAASYELARLFELQDKNLQAEEHYRTAVRVFEDSEDYDNCVKSLIAAGKMYVRMCKLAEGEQAFKNALSMAQQQLGPDHARVAESADALASCYMAKGHYDAAETNIRKSIAINQKAFGQDAPLVGLALATLALCLTEQKRLNDAEENYARAIQILMRFRGQLTRPQLQVMCRCYHELGRIHMNAGKVADALKFFDEALHLCEEAPPYLLESELIDDQKPCVTRV